MTPYGGYEKAVLWMLWTWADQHHRGELDGVHKSSSNQRNCFLRSLEQIVTEAIQK